MKPACWSWEVPPMRVAEEEIARDVAAQAGLPVSSSVSVRVLRRLYADMETVRFREFHSGSRGLVGAAVTRCAVCGGGEREPIEDHDHDTGWVRGLLCRSCNVLEGRGSAELLEAYRLRSPAAILGYRRRYVGRGWPSGWWEEAGHARS